MRFSDIEKSFLCAVSIVALTALTAASASAQPTAYAFVPNLGDNTLSVIDTAAASTVGSPIGTGVSPQSSAASPDGRRVYVTNNISNTVSVIDVPTLTPVSTISVGTRPFGIAITPDGQKAYVSNNSDGTISVLNLATNTVTTTIPLGISEAPRYLAITPDGQKMLVAAGSGNVWTIALATDTVVGIPLTVGAQPGGIAISPDGATAYVPDGAAGTLVVMDIASNSVTMTIPVGSVPTGVAVSPDGLTVYVTNANDNTVSVIDPSTNTVTNTIAVSGTQPQSVIFTPNSQTAFVVETGSNIVETIDVPSGTVTGAIFSGTSPADIRLGPNLIAGCFECGATIASDDASLTAQGFKQFLNFLSGGTLFVTGDLTTSRTVSLLNDGVAPYAGTVYTGSHHVTFTGNMINDGVLLKEGSGSLTLTGTSAPTARTRVEEGTLVISGTQAGTVQVGAGAGTVGTLAGTGTIGSIDAQAGTVSPGVGGPGILHATNASLVAGVTFAVDINGPTAGTGYDQLNITGGADIGGSTLDVHVGFTPTAGAAFTILTNATGTFAGLPEGTFFTAAGGTRFRITYQAGSGADVALLVDTPPTISGLGNQQIVIGATLGPILFSVGDDLTPATALTVSATSSNQTLLPNADIILGGSANSRTLTTTPNPGASGTTTIMVTVSDGMQTAQESFVLTVLPIPVYYLSEGATGGFFSTDLLLANPNDSAAPVDITYYKDDGTTVPQHLLLPATSRTTVTVNQVPGMESTAFSTSVTSSTGLNLAVERTMWWDATGYGSSGEKASAAAASQWYFAEGSQGFFHTYFLLLNPHQVSIVAHATYFLDDGSTVLKDYTIAATSRFTVDAGGESELVNRSFGALFTFDLPGMAERAMYFGTNPVFTGGHDAAGVNAPNKTWFLAEGATGSYFDTFILIANPNSVDANVTVTYLPDNGVPIQKAHLVAAHQRLTINIAGEDPALASAAVSTRVDADQPVTAERSMYWPHGGWHEAHNSTGETAAGTKWGLAEGRVGGSNNAQTYILIANPGTQTADVLATFLRTNGTTVIKHFTVAPTSRFNISITGPGSSVPELADESFGTVIESSQPVIVERSLYTDANGVTWAAGTNATATRLP